MGTSVAVTVLLLWVTWYVLVVVPAFVPRTILPVPAPVIIFAPLSVVYGAPKWHRCENRLLHAGTLRRRVHPPHLHPRHTAKARRGRTDNGQLHGTGHVTSDAEAKDHRAGYSARWPLFLFAPFNVWVTVWVKNFHLNFLQRKTPDSFRNQAFLELLPRFELGTSSLPRMRSTD